MAHRDPRKPTAPVASKSYRSSLWFNILLMTGVAILLYFFIFSSLSFITQHGAEVNVPSVTGRPLNTALDVLQKAGFDIEIDSSYEAGRKPLEILMQQPLPGSVVKQNRTIYLTVNKAEPPAAQMPNLVNLSFRSATLILKSHRLVLGDTIFRPDIAAGAVLEQLYNGRPVAAGTSLPQGSRITLVVGDGLGETEFNVPDVIGMTFNEGRALMMGNGLNFVPVFEGSISDSGNAIIYNQVPSPFNEGGAPNRKRQGDYVDLFIKTDPTQEEMESNRRPKPAVLYEDSYGTPSSTPGAAPSRPKAVLPDSARP
ncbi:MAG: PASTA domain-containing protein [Sphingobacteriales bacterium]|nr:MAG: PASTA domain-containing protein [Sphingobacteriales bacterium]